MNEADHHVGFRSRRHDMQVDGDRALAYARATNDTFPYAQGTCAPLFAAVPCVEPLAEVVRAVLPEPAWTRMIHFAQDFHFHTPLISGAEITATAIAHSVRSISLGTLLCIRSQVCDRLDRVLVDMFSTVLVMGLRAGGSAGDYPPDHRVLGSGEPAVTATAHVDSDQTYRYADASGDNMPVHLNNAVAREMGMKGIILHGMCGMAMAGSRILCAVDAGDPRLLRRLAVRFVRPVFPGNDLVISIRPAEVVPAGRMTAWAFTVKSEGRIVMNDGLAVIGEPAARATVAPNVADEHVSQAVS